MVKHFPHLIAAIKELREFGFRQMNDGNWFNATCHATIHPIHGQQTVRVFYVERVTA